MSLRFPRPTAKKERRGGALLLALALCLSCASRGPGPNDSPVLELRKQAASSHDKKLVARWLLAELISPQGSAEQALQARKALGEEGGGMYAELGRGLDDAMHGKLKSVADRYLRAAAAARDENDTNSALVAWFATQQASLFRHSDPKLFERWKPFVRAALDDPRNIGWRARAELADFWQEEAWSQAEKDVVEKGARLHGCAENARLVGPFGRNVGRDTMRSFPPEKPGPWPSRFSPDPGVGEPPRIVESERDGCYISVKEPSGAGIYYVETFFDLPKQTDVLIAVQGAYGLWIDDHRVLTRDLREWGSWPRFGVALSLSPGRHRLLGRIGDPGTSIRLLHADGRTLDVKTSSDPSQPYQLSAPKLLPEANVLDRYLKGGKLVDPGDDLVRFLAAIMANVETQPDVANVLFEPLVEKPEQATGPVLAMSAMFAEADPIFSDSQHKDLSRELEERAVARDKRLWHPRLLLALNEAERDGNTGAARAVKKLVDEFPEVPAVLSELTRLYSELGWKVEYSKTALELSQRFPDDPAALEAAVDVLDAQGKTKEADALVERIQNIDPDREIRLQRALNRQDYELALKELKSIGERRPQRKDIAERIADVMVRSGNRSESWNQLEAAIKNDPKSEKARLDLGDAGYASGKHDALVRALLDAITSGSPSAKLEEAIDLVEGVSELEPYRRDARTIIKEYERSGEQLAGTAARVLDYAAVWVHADGSSRMLEHEIIKVQSAEAISDLAEQPVQNGIMLHMRVIKQDGTILEPEFVEGKQTLTMPHLEAGDYIETERIESQPGDGQRGARYLGPRWFFREENIAYARSEFMIISPKSKPLEVETRNDVPKPEVKEDGAIIARHWRVDRSPAAPVEPFGAPIVEFLPSVQVGWGVSLERTLEAMTDASVDLSPVDPRIARIAEHIVAKVPPEKREERAKLLYRWLVTNVQEGEEGDGRRVIIGKNGNLWRGFITLCRAVGITTTYSVAQSKLTLPATGPFSSASLLSIPLLRVKTEKDDVWLSLGSKYAPFGYVPAEARGMPAYALTDKGPESTRVPVTGLADSVSYTGDVELAADGSALVNLEQTMNGKYGTGLRGALAEMPAQQVRDVIETRLVGHALRGARLEKYDILHIDDPDQPLVIRTRSRVPSFAQVAGSVLLIAPPFAPRIGQLAALPARQTPLLVVDSTEQQIVLKLRFPKGATLAAPVAAREIADGEYKVVIRDRQEGSDIILDRRIVLPSGRIQVDAYPGFLRFARTADDSLSASVRVRLAKQQ
jgi:tetratricopeptide (TPR) repeat protein